MSSMCIYVKQKICGPLFKRDSKRSYKDWINFHFPWVSRNLKSLSSEGGGHNADCPRSYLWLRRVWHSCLSKEWLIPLLIKSLIKSLWWDLRDQNWAHVTTHSSIIFFFKWFSITYTNIIIFKNICFNCIFALIVYLSNCSKIELF